MLAWAALLPIVALATSPHVGDGLQASDTNGDGLIDRREFVGLMRRRHTEIAIAGNPSALDAALIRMHARYDRDADGFLTPAEFDLFISDSEPATSPDPWMEQWADVLKQIDSDANGLDPEELAAALPLVLGLAWKDEYRRYFSMADRDGNGLLVSIEALGALREINVDARTSELFDALDRNGDNGLDLAELLEWLSEIGWRVGLQAALQRVGTMGLLGALVSSHRSAAGVDLQNFRLLANGLKSISCAACQSGGAPRRPEMRPAFAPLRVPAASRPPRLRRQAGTGPAIHAHARRTRSLFLAQCAPRTATRNAKST